MTTPDHLPPGVSEEEAAKVQRSANIRALRREEITKVHSGVFPSEADVSLEEASDEAVSAMYEHFFRNLT